MTYLLQLTGPDAAAAPTDTAAASAAADTAVDGRTAQEGVRDGHVQPGPQPWEETKEINK